MPGSSLDDWCSYPYTIRGLYSKILVVSAIRGNAFVDSRVGSTDYEEDALSRFEMLDGRDLSRSLSETMLLDSVLGGLSDLVGWLSY